MLDGCQYRIRSRNDPDSIARAVLESPAKVEALRQLAD
jgi:hypothetical protein